jgi:hypothetical protein
MLLDSLLSSVEKELRASLDTCVTGMVATARTQLEAALAKVAKERAKGLAEVARERAKLHREIEAMQTHKEAQEGRVELNIGGRRFETSVQTLRRVPNTFFDAYFSGRYAQDVCADGSIFVDRDGEHFSHVLEYMRDGVVSVAAQEASELDVSLLCALKHEFDFYCIELKAEPEEVLFVVGGEIGGDNSISTLERYDNVSGKWMEGAPMMTARSCFGLCEVGEMLYVSGGYGAENVQLESVECYDFTLDTWSAAPPMPCGRVSHGACVVGDTMYVLGGYEDGAWTRSAFMFDIGAQVWSEMAPMPRALHKCRACALGSNIFIFGCCGSGNDESLSATTYCYNTATDVWSTLAPMPEAIMNHSVCVVSGLIYVIGGERNSGIGVSSAYRFDPAMDAWSMMAPMLGVRVGLVSLVRGENIYAAGGVNGAGLLSSMERYDVLSDSWQVVSDMALSTVRADFGAQVMTLEVSLFDSLETKARRQGEGPHQHSLHCHSVESNTHD